MPEPLIRPLKTLNPKGTTMHENPNRRRFLKLAGASAASLAALRCAGRAAQAQQEPADRKKPTLTPGLASYSTRKFTLDETLDIAKRVGLEHICLKSFHLPLSASAEECAAARAKVEAAGLDLYGGGVIRMGDEEQARRAFDYAKAAGMRTIIGVPAPPVLPLVNDLVQKYDIRVAIHNHGPGDKTYPTPESAIVPAASAAGIPGHAAPNLKSGDKSPHSKTTACYAASPLAVAAAPRKTARPRWPRRSGCRRRRAWGAARASHRGPARRR